VTAFPPRRPVARVDRSAVCSCDESIALRAPQSAGIAEKIERLREDAAQRAREWRRYGHEFEAIEWDAVARWLGSVK
jgi:hypothetical protein